jgi:hypothetical protein
MTCTRRAQASEFPHRQPADRDAFPRLPGRSPPGGLKRSMPWRIRLSLPCLAGRGPAGSIAGAQLEIITLRHRSAAQIVPALRPLRGAGWCREHPGRQDPDAGFAGQPCRTAHGHSGPGHAAAATCGVGAPGPCMAGGRALTAVGGSAGAAGHPIQARQRRQPARGVSQQVQVLEGGRALIRVGQSLPLVMREWRATPEAGCRWIPCARADVGSGFYALPQVLGDRVNASRSVRRMERVGPDGVMESARLTTTVSAGRWARGFPWGPVSRTPIHGLRHHRIGPEQQQSGGQVWLRVDAIE